MGNILKGILYTGLAGMVGVGGYMLGKYKYLGNKVSLTMIGLAFVLYAPKGCDVAETYIKEHAGVEKARVYGKARKDSIDAVINSEKERDSTLYLKQFIQNVSNTSKQLEATYKGIINENDTRYQRLLQQNDKQYDKVLTGMIKQNEVLKKDLEILKTVTSPSKSYNNEVASENSSIAETKTHIDVKPSTNTNVTAVAKSEPDPYADPAVWVSVGKRTSIKTTETGIFEDKVLPNGRKVVIVYKK